VTPAATRPTATARSGRHRLAALSLVGAAVLLPLAGPASSYADDPSPSVGASPGPSANDDAPAQLLITTLAPRAPADPAGFFQVRGYVTNRGSQPLHALTVRLRRGEKLSTRDQLTTADSEPPTTGTRVGRTPVRAAVQDLAPGATTTFDIRVRISQLQMLDARAGVYPLKVEARARFGDSASYDAVGSVLTYLPYFPDGPPSGKVRLAWLWPLVDQPRRGPREVMLDDELAASFARGGRLDRLLRAAADGARGGCDRPADPPATLPRPPAGLCRGESVPVTYAVDPDLLFTADALSAPYQLVTHGSATRRVDNTAPARSWVAALRDAVAGADVLSLPYADPDVVALTAPESGLADEVPLLRELGRNETTKILGKQPLTTVVWPPTGRLTRPAVESLTSGGGTAIVIDPAALPAPDSGPNRTPDTDVGQLPTNTGAPSVLTIDPQLSALLTPDSANYPGDRLAEQRWLAETAMISAEAPSISRTILVAPARRADLHTALAAEAIKDTGRLPWLCPVALARVATGTDVCSGEARPETVAAPPVELEPPHPGDPQLGARFLSRVRGLRRLSTQFTDEVLAEPTSTDAVHTTGRLARARARTESSAWRTQPTAGEEMLGQLQDDVTGLRNKVHLQIGSGTVTLTSSSGVISVNVVNELSQPVRVGVTLNPGNRARLSTRATPITTVGSGRATQITLKVTAQTSGTFPVIARLVDREGRPFGPAVRLIVRSTQYGRVALAVTGIGAGVLLVAVGIRITRRALHRNRA
jgi:hypothetical protein